MNQNDWDFLLVVICALSGDPQLAMAAFAVLVIMVHWQHKNLASQHFKGFFILEFKFIQVKMIDIIKLKHFECEKKLAFGIYM